jgi:[ribosomal protein S18]-alanine N-acetyltransferase
MIDHLVERNLLVSLDVSQLMAVEQACHEFPWSQKTMESCLSGRYFNGCIVKGGRLIGFYIAERAGPDVSLMDICVDPDNQGKGYANALIMDFIQCCEAYNTENVFLEVRESNTPAIALYEKFGFIETGLRKNYYPSSSGKENAILMAMTLAF